jgi:hypothetical protein
MRNGLATNYTRCKEAGRYMYNTPRHTFYVNHGPGSVIKVLVLPPMLDTEVEHFLVICDHSMTENWTILRT